MIYHCPRLWSLWRVNLRALGNWSPGRKPQTALQQIVLNGGRDYGDVFSKYKVAVGEVINYIYRCLDYHAQDSSTESQSMTILRRVFTQVASWNRNSRCVLEPGNDPLDHMCSLNDEWKVFDFVDVCVGFDIVTRRDRQGKTIHRVHLTMEYGDDAMMVVEGEVCFHAPGLTC
ncbi:hypothetical protein B0H13DRAFT_2037378 [Mycena leptocephala]|nr:hypothetical protein B0H13DRAFT_2037378 [Mycena leptocephala]